MERRRFLASVAASAAGLTFGRPASAAEQLKFTELYKGAGILGMQMSDKLLSLEGKRVEIAGFMAPPLKAEATFFVLTSEPVLLCPFCNSEADWPADIIVVYLEDALRFVQYNQAILTSGTLEIGSKLDPQTGFVSQIRLMASDYHKLTS
jgi:hypothetical protein